MKTHIHMCDVSLKIPHIKYYQSIIFTSHLFYCWICTEIKHHFLNKLVLPYISSIAKSYCTVKTNRGSQMYFFSRFLNIWFSGFTSWPHQWARSSAFETDRREVTCLNPIMLAGLIVRGFPCFFVTLNILA